MDTLVQLIEIYGRQPLAAVQNDADYQQLCQSNDNNLLFHHQRHLVEDLKRKLEQTVEIQQSAQKRVKYALRLFQRLLGSEAQADEICVRLTKRAYDAGWTATQRSYFDAATVRLRDSQDYFLSFTQRHDEGASNPVNRRHRYLIQSYGIPDPKDSASNELALMLHRALHADELRGFFFPEHEDDSARVSEKLKKAMQRSLVFVQLVQNDMFSKRFPLDHNYCYAEYCDAMQQGKSMVYLFADGEHPADLIDEFNAHFALDTWYGYVREVDCISLDPTDIAEQSANVPANRQKLKTKLIERVKSEREAIWESVPGDLE